MFAGSDQGNAELFVDATATTDRANYVPLPGVGDQAVRKATDGSVVVSKKGNLYCTVSMAGGLGADVAKLNGEELAKKLGALCNKVYSAK